jgi:FAD binding domain
MHALDIDPAQRTAWAQTGLTAGAYTTAANAYGLATGFGDTASVGIGGLTLGGGIGYLVRKHGLTIDSLLAAEVVTADGRLLHVDAETHPELFWALRGGGNFGVATRFQFRLHELGQFVGGLLVLPATPDTIAGFVAQAQAAPEELSTIANIMAAPPLPFLPTDQHGRPVIMATLAHAGDLQAGQRALAAFRALAPPIADLVRPCPTPALPARGGGPPPHRGVAHDAGRHHRPRGDPRAPAGLDRAAVGGASAGAGGAMARVPAQATAFAHRARRYRAG